MESRCPPFRFYIAFLGDSSMNALRTSSCLAFCQHFLGSLMLYIWHIFSEVIGREHRVASAVYGSKNTIGLQTDCGTNRQCSRGLNIRVRAGETARLATKS
jgi:hypothetical protein